MGMVMTQFPVSFMKDWARELIILRGYLPPSSSTTFRRLANNSGQLSKKMDFSQTQAPTTQLGPDFDLFLARADQIRPRIGIEGIRLRLYHEERRILIHQHIRRRFDALISLYIRLGCEIRPEFDSFETLLSESRRRQSVTAFRQEFFSFEDFVTDLGRRRDDPAFDRASDSFEGFMCELDLFEEFMFMSDLRRLQNETIVRPEFNPHDEFRSDLVDFDEFMLIQWTHANFQLLNWEE